MKGVAWFIARWFLKLSPLLVLLVLLQFYLPGHEVVRMDRAGSTAPAEGGGQVVTTRDVRFINVARPDGKVVVFRNEDTDWGFPWYFKFHSGTLQGVAQDLVSTSETPRWVAITHYGWRIEVLSMFPNAVRIKPVEGPGVTIIPWFNIVFLTLLAVGLFFLWRAWRRLMERLALDERFENASNGLAQVWRWQKANREDRRSRSARAE